MICNKCWIQGIFCGIMNGMEERGQQTALFPDGMPVFVCKKCGPADICKNV